MYPPLNSQTQVGYPQALEEPKKHYNVKLWKYMTYCVWRMCITENVVAYC